MPSASRIIGAFQSIKFSVPAIKILISEFKNLIIKKNFWKWTTSSNFNKLLLTNVSYKNYEKDLILLDRVNIEINKGKVGIIGESGAGKSTLINLILGLTYPIDGKIEYYEIGNKLPQNQFRGK